MKIVFDGLIYYLQKQGGISRYFDELIEDFSSREDCEVVVLLRNNKINKIFNSNVKIEIIDSTINLNNKILKYISVFLDKRKVNSFFKYHDFSDFIFHYSYYSCYKNINVKSVLTVHDLVHEKFPNFFKGFLNKIYLNNKKEAIMKADDLIAISEQTKKDLIKIYKIDSKKITVIHHGLNKDFKVLSKINKENFLKNKKIDKPYFLFVGNRTLYKNFNFLLVTLATWNKKNNYNLYCVGGGKFTDKEKIIIKKLKLEDKTKLFLSVSENELVNFYNSSQGLIFPSLYEGFGFPVLEAMACGTPALASDIEIFHEIGKDGPIYFNPMDSQSLINALDASLLVNEDRINRGIEITKSYRWKNTIHNTLEVYKNIL